MKVVADTNTFIAVALNEPERLDILSLTKGCELTAPAILPFEVGNALSAMHKKGVLQPDEVVASWRLIQHIPVELKEVHIQSALRVSARFGIYAYDAYFLECAYRYKNPLITLDRGMKRIALEMGIAILE